MLNNALFCKSEDCIFECFTAWWKQRVMTLVLTTIHHGAGFIRRSLWECRYLVHKTRQIHDCFALCWERFISSQHVWCSPWYLQEVCPWFTAANSPSHFTLSCIHSSLSWAPAAGQRFWGSSGLWCPNHGVATEEISSSHGSCNYSCHCRKAEPMAPQCLRTSSISSCSPSWHSTPFWPLQHVSPCTHSTAQQPLTHEEEEQVFTFQHKGFLPQTAPVRSNSALCLTIPAGFTTCGTV